jgi:hypothetical protein
MQTADRAAPHLMLGSLTLLTVAAIVLSLATAPPDAQEQLRSAAADTAAASSFVLTDVETAGPLSAGGKAAVSSRQEAVIVYQAPDRVEETVHSGGRSASVLVVGDKRFERSANGKWYDLGRSASGATGGPTPGQVAAGDILFPWQSLSKATSVSESGGVYHFVPGQPELLLARLIGTNVSPSSTTYSAGLQGEFVRYEQVTIRLNGEQVTVRLTLSRVERAPALPTPTGAQLTTVPPAS